MTHFRLFMRTGNKRELQNIVTNAVLLSLSLVIAWGRWAGR